MSADSVLRWYGVTDKGRFRKNNEDAFLALAFDTQEMLYLGKIGKSELNGRDFIFAVSDGMGGANAGEYASEIAVKKIADLLPKSFGQAAMGLTPDCPDQLREVVSQTHYEMLEMGRHYEELEGMGATLSLLWFGPERMFFAHVGDSRIYYLPKGKDMNQLSEDHTHVGSLVRSGKISEYEAKMRPDRNILEQALGGQAREPVPQLGSVIYQKGDRFAICSDGVSDGISNSRIERLMTTDIPIYQGKNPAEKLILDAISERTQDNVTALVVDVE